MKHFMTADFDWGVLVDVDLAAAERFAATKVVFVSRRRAGFLVMAGLDKLPDSCTPVFSITWILVFTNLITLWTDG